MTDLIGIGTYTPAEAASLLAIPTAKISRWLQGHSTHGKSYAALWDPEILIEGRIYLGFRDLMEVRVADAFIKKGLSAFQIRRAIQLARDEIGSSHPFATNSFHTDGREIFLRVIGSDSAAEPSERLLNLFRRQYEFRGVIDPVLSSIDFGQGGEPTVWWPRGRGAKIVLDPKKSFGQPIETTSSVPTKILATAASVFGVKIAAKNFEVSESAVIRSVEFESLLLHRIAA